jgi:hypothetical protein
LRRHWGWLSKDGGARGRRELKQLGVDGGDHGCPAVENLATTPRLGPYGKGEGGARRQTRHVGVGVRLRERSTRECHTWFSKKD